MEEFDTIPDNLLQGDPSSLILARRRLKRAVADRRQQAASVAHADRMANPEALDIMRSAEQHGDTLNDYHAIAAERDVQRELWREEKELSSRAAEYATSMSLMHRVDEEFKGVVRTEHAFRGTGHPSDDLVTSFAATTR